MTLLLLALLISGLTGLLLVRSVPPVGRALGVPALAMLMVAALDPKSAELQEVPARVALLATLPGESAAALDDLTARAAAAGATALPIDASGALAERLAAGALRAGPRSDELVLLWTGDTGRDAVPGLHGTALSPVPALPFEPDALGAALAGPLAVGRPGLLEVSAAVPLPMAVTVVLRDGSGAVLIEQELTLPPGGTEALAWTPAEPGTVSLELRARLAGVEVVRRGRLTVVAPQPVVVVDRSGVAAAALSAQGMRVVTAASLPEDLQDYAAVFLAEPLHEDPARRLTAAVDAGLGLLVTGAALAEPGPLADLLPVRLLPWPEVATAETGPGAGRGERPAADRPPPSQPPSGAPPGPPEPPTGDTAGAQLQPGPPVEVDVRTVAMVLVIDRSGSMAETVGGQQKMSYAKTSASQTARQLGEGDLVGVVTFGNQDAGRIELPMTDATRREVVQEGIQRLAARAESTYLLAGLQRAGELLRPVKAPVRHIVVISDGEIVISEWVALVREARQLRTAGVTVSMVQIAGAETTSQQARAAEEITKTGGGRYLPVRDVASVPVMVSAELVQALDRVGRRPGGAGPGPGDGPPPEHPEPAPPELPKPEPSPQPTETLPDEQHSLEVRAVADSALLEPAPAPAWPRLGGAFPAAGTADAHVLLVAGGEGHVLLAFGNRGLGRVAAFCADLPGSDCAAFRAETGFPGRLAQWVEALRRPQAESQPRAVLEPGAEIRPRRPTPRQAMALAAAVGSPLRPAAEWSVPPPRVEVTARGCAAEWALFATVLLLVLALGEWLVTRLRPNG